MGEFEITPTIELMMLRASKARQVALRGETLLRTGEWKDTAFNKTEMVERVAIHWGIIKGLVSAVSIMVDVDEIKVRRQFKAYYDKGEVQNG